jgi:hypothetical protein
MSTVRARFRVMRVEHHGWKTTIVLWPVCVGSPENDAFFASTPSGLITLDVKNEVAAEQFKEWKEYYVDFTRAE